MPEDTWAKPEIDVTPEATLEVCKKERTTLDVPDKESVVFVLAPQVTWHLHPSRYSSWTRLLIIDTSIHELRNAARREEFWRNCQSTDLRSRD